MNTKKPIAYNTWVDVGCDDFDKARRNRELIAQGKNDEFYKQLESWLRHTPRNQPLPNWISKGRVPEISSNDWAQYGGSKAGLTEIKE